VEQAVNNRRFTDVTFANKQQLNFAQGAAGLEVSVKDGLGFKEEIIVAQDSSGAKARDCRATGVFAASLNDAAAVAA
jgi:hypothetical protein